ncbi:MAG: glycosyltransferase family 4 protein [Actinobacteria bacterium]|nr:glycosyltransferase family 4 protein [Actinomycetota bacterium]
MDRRASQWRRPVTSRPSARQPQVSIALFDPSGTAHSRTALPGLTRAAIGQGLHVTVFAPERDLGPGAQWTLSQSKNVLNDRRARDLHRTCLNVALEAFGPGANRVFCDLGLDRTLLSQGSKIHASDATVFVCHRTASLDRPPSSLAQRWRRAGSRRLLRKLGAAGAHFVTHTELVRARLSDFTASENVHRLGWPVVSREDPCLGPSWRPSPEDRMLLVPGSARAEKGLAQLVRGVGSVTAFDRLVVQGRLNTKLRAQLEGADPRVQLWDRWLETEEYREAFRGASLVVLPYQDHYLTRGTLSSVLLEAMAFGRPLVVSKEISDLLPPGYPGAVTMDTSTERGIASGLEEALATIDELEEAAMHVGRAYIAEHHTYEGYLAALVSIASRGAPGSADAEVDARDGVPERSTPSQ